MKQNIHHPVSARQSRDGLYYLYYPRGWIIITLLLLSTMTIAQEQTPPPEELIYGGSWNREFRYNEAFYNTFRASGLNFLSQYADPNPLAKELLDGLNFYAANGEHPYEWIQYYATSYYSKWEAEEDQTHRYRAGFKHREKLEGEEILGDSIGSPATYSGRECWSTVGLTSPRDSLIYGPHYFQEKVYKRWYLEQYNYDRDSLKYTPRFIMALNTLGSINPNDTICRLKVVSRYRWQVNGVITGNDSDMVLKSIYLKASDFLPYGEFKEFYFGEIDTAWYQYPPEFKEPSGGNKRDFSGNSGVFFFDRWGDQGIQFCVDWLGDNSKCNLYIDYVEVYDNDGGHHFANQPALINSRVVAYAQSFPQSEWPNLKYWAGPDEPSSLDNYTPMKTVDGILESIGAPRIITKFYPWWEVTVNGDTQLVRYYNTVHPEKLMIDFFPFLSFRYPSSFDDWEATRTMFQICHSLQPGFWYQAQAFGNLSNGQWYVWRMPDTSEFKAQTMLALAHGVKGIINESFTSLRGELDGTQGIINMDGTTTEIYDVIKNNLVPRLKGKLGNTIKDLNYSGNFLKFQRRDQESPPPPVEYNYLTLSEGTPSMLVMNWHCGFFDRAAHPDDNYFMLVNLITTDAKIVKVTLKPPVNTQFTNYRFRNIEGLFDTTFRAPNIFEKQIEHNAGEGYLYQFSPVIKYGGRLLYSESTQPEIILEDDMTIENGAVLTINGIYSSKGNITVKSGGIINGSNGKIQFVAGKKLIIEGSGSITGAANSKLHLVFSEPVNDDPTGIMIKAGGSLTINNCKIENAAIGINSLLNANYLNAQNVEFINCGNYSISIAGRSSGMNSTPPRRYLIA